MSAPFLGLPISTGAALATLVCAPALGFFYSIVLAALP